MDQKTRERLYREQQAKVTHISQARAARERRNAALALLDQSDRDWLEALPQKEQDFVSEMVAKFHRSTFE